MVYGVEVKESFYVPFIGKARVLTFYERTFKKVTIFLTVVSIHFMSRVFVGLLIDIREDRLVRKDPSLLSSS